MKALGYHERLVNMLACITESEPYCLIVEYCSDGDLLHFLRKRCAYMMKVVPVQLFSLRYEKRGLERYWQTDFANGSSIRSKIHQ